MQYDFLIQLGLGGGTIIALIVLLKDYSKKDREVYKQHDALVNKVINDSKERENKLVKQLDRYNDSLIANTEILSDISETLKEIPLMRKDIEELKNRCKEE